MPGLIYRMEFSATTVSVQDISSVHETKEGQTYM